MSSHDSNKPRNLQQAEINYMYPSENEDFRRRNKINKSYTFAGEGETSEAQQQIYTCNEKNANKN